LIRSNKLIWLFLFSFAIILLSCKSSDKTYIIHSSDFGLGDAKDSSPAVLRMLKEASRHNHSKILIPRGEYHFYPDKAFQKYCYITNHDNGLRSIAFPVIDMSNIQIEADSATFIFHGIMIPFYIENAENVRLSGFTIDWEMPLHSEVEVIAVDQSEHTFDIRIKEDVPYYIRNGELLFLKEGYEHNLDRSICWDKETMAPLFMTSEITPLTLRKPAETVFVNAFQPLYDPDPLTGEYRYRGTENSLIAEEISEGIVRIHGQRKELPKKGSVIVAKGLNAYNRYAPAISSRMSKDLVLENITVHHAGGMGFVAERTENIELNNFNVALKPGSGRMLTTTADATHFNNCKGLVEIRNCTFENMLDDGTNIHGVYMEITDIIDENTIGARIGHFQQAGFHFADKGDKVGFISGKKSLFPIQENIVSHFEKINDRYYLISFEEHISPEVKIGQQLENLDWYPEVIAENNVVRNNRARGFLFRTPKKIVCKGNFFSSMSSSIVASAHSASSWYESGFVQDILIKDNFFAEGNYGDNGGSLISIEASGTNDSVVFRRVRIESNEFLSSEPFLLSINKIDSLFIENNIIGKSDKYPIIDPTKPVMDISTARYTLFSENIFHNYDRSKISVDEYSRMNLVEEQNNWNKLIVSRSEE